jgi:hypothetical protein
VRVRRAFRSGRDAANGVDQLCGVEGFDDPAGGAGRARSRRARRAPARRGVPARHPRALLAGCAGGDDKDAPALLDTGWFDSDVPTGCTARLDSTTPASGASGWYWRTAPEVLVTEAGGVVLAAGECDSAGKLLPGVTWREALAKQQPVTYNKRNPLNPFFVVYGRRLKD